MDISPVIAQLKASLVGFKKVGGAADLASIGKGLVPTPSAYVLPATELAGDMAVASNTFQRVGAQFCVVLAAENKASAQGEAAVIGLEPLRDQVKAALVGWRPLAGADPVAFASGSIVSFDDSVLFWIDDFKTAYYTRSVQ